MSTLTIAEFKLQTGGGRYADAILQEIIDQAEREIQGWIDLYDLTVTVSKASSSLLSKAGLYERMHMDGGLPGESGAKYYNLADKAENLRIAAKALIFETTEEAAAAAEAETASNYMVKKANE